MNLEKLIIRPAIADDVLKIAEVEDKCFPAAEAASAKRFFERFIAFPECFFVAEVEGKIVGHINGCATSYPTILDAMYLNTTLHEPDGPWQTVFGIAVLPECQRQGIATKLMTLTLALTMLKAEVRIETGRCPASLFAFSSFS